MTDLSKVVFEAILQSPEGFIQNPENDTYAVIMTGELLRIARPELVEDGILADLSSIRGDLIDG